MPVTLIYVLKFILKRNKLKKNLSGSTDFYIRSTTQFYRNPSGMKKLVVDK
jgi:hypothetical protein